MNSLSNEHAENELVSDDDRTRVGDLPLVSDQLPHYFQNGTSVGRLAVNCGGCGANVEEIRGAFEVTNNGMTLALNDGYAVCYACRTLTPVAAKFLDDGSYLAKKENGWERGVYKVAMAPWSPSWIVAMLRQKIGI